MFIAATVPVEHEGAVSPLMEAAQQIGEPITETAPEQPRQARETVPGDFERFMGSFGTPARWAGRS